MLQIPEMIVKGMANLGYKIIKKGPRILLPLLKK